VVTAGNLGIRRARRLQIHRVQPTLVPSPSLNAPRRRTPPRRIEAEGLLVIHSDAKGLGVRCPKEVSSRVRASIASEEPGLSAIQEPHPPGLGLIPVVEARCDGRSA
jgi:hypothetical protein